MGLSVMDEVRRGGRYGTCSDELGSAMCCVTEFASALGIKQRTGRSPRPKLKRHGSVSSGFAPTTCTCYPSNRRPFIAPPCLDAATDLRAGDSLHLAAALETKAKSMATLDEVLANNANRMKLKLTAR